MVEQFVQPIFADDFRIVVQQHQVLAARLAGRQIIHGAEVERMGEADDSQFVTTNRVHLVQPDECLLGLAAIIDQDNLEVWIARLR
ncbi:hypothetical protein D3C73_1371680 [compost metagenome]